MSRLDRAAGMPTAEILDDYPDLEPDDLLAVLEYEATLRRSR
ncbi:DUF433 domain-containing protein [Nocardia sp. NPDC059239]